MSFPIVAESRLRADVASLARELGLGEVPSNWNGCDAIWNVLEKIADSGSIIVIKLDGQRTGPADSGRYTVVLSGGPLGEDFFRLDTPNLDEGLAQAILFYARKCWGKP